MFQVQKWSSGWFLLGFASSEIPPQESTWHRASWSKYLLHYIVQPLKVRSALMHRFQKRPVNNIPRGCHLRRPSKMLIPNVRRLLAACPPVAAHASAQESNWPVSRTYKQLTCVDQNWLFEKMNKEPTSQSGIHHMPINMDNCTIIKSHFASSFPVSLHDTDLHWSKSFLYGRPETVALWSTFGTIFAPGWPERIRSSRRTRSGHDRGAAGCRGSGVLFRFGV